MSGTDRPDEAVHTFLGRPGRQRSTRTLTDHLHPRPARPATRVSLERADRAPTPPRPALSLERSDRARRPAPAPTPAPTPTPAPASASARPATPPPAPAAVGQARASERRIVLDDDDPVLTIPAAERSSGTLRFTLQWEQQITSSGLHRSSDVHLGCFWETRDRHAGALQSLGDLLAAPGFGARQVLRLGPRSEQGGEEVLADAAHLGLLRRMVFFVYPTGSQAPDYANLAPRLTIARRGGGAVEAWTHAPPADARTAVIASLHDVGGDLVVRRENEFFPGPARDVALAYGFDDLEWNSEGTVPRSS